VIRVRVTVVRRRLVLRRAIQLGAVLGTPVILQRGVEKVGHLAHRLADVGASLHERTREASYCFAHSWPPASEPAIAPLLPSLPSRFPTLSMIAWLA